MFAWRDGHAALIEPLDVRPGCRVLDYGCGPGFVATAMAGLAGPGGRVYGVDINARFVADASRRAEGVEHLSHLSYYRVENGRIPLPDDAVDRLLCKNVLEYVPDVPATLAEFRRVLEPGGCVLTIDSDWGFVIVEPWGRARTERFFAAASAAFKTPEIGRRLRGELIDAGFVDVEASVRAGVDTAGGSLEVLRNMASYAAACNAMPAAEIGTMIAAAETAAEAGRYLFCLPQFIVRARQPVCSDRRAPGRRASPTVAA